MMKFSDPSTIEPVSTLDELIVKLKEVFSEDKVNIEYVTTLMESYKSNPREWKKYAKYDPHRYTRNLVDEGNGKFNLMILCWGENQGSSIHSHAGSHCFLKVLNGQMQEIRYEWPDDAVTKTDYPENDDCYKEDQSMRKMDEMTFKKDAVTYISDEIGLHRMENPSHSDGAVTLHLYSPPFMECYTFDERTAKRNTSKMTFWSKFGERTPFKPSDGARLCEEAENN